MNPPGALVARWYCPQGHRTFSLLPDCLAARLPGTLAEVETVVDAVEAAPSQEKAADHLRPQAELPSALRWTRRRVHAVYSALTVLRGLDPERFEGVPATLRAWRAHLGVNAVLATLREGASDYLRELPAPLGFSHRRRRGGESHRTQQHDMGPDPPSVTH
jgi:hypothetical protein